MNLYLQLVNQCVMNCKSVLSLFSVALLMCLV